MYNFSSLKSPKSGSNVVKRKERKKGRWGQGRFKSRPHLVKKEKISQFKFWLYTFK